MSTDWLDLTRPEISYLFGFLQADGHLAKGPGQKGRLRIELQARDGEILQRFAVLFPVHTCLKERTRDTNFKKNYSSISLTVYDLETRTALNQLGLPYGKKDTLVAPPKVPYSKSDYFRGLLDGDGSVGITANGLPFISWMTTSPVLAEGILDFIFEITGQTKTNNPNKRDHSFNIMVTNEKAQDLARFLYPEGCLALERKRAKTFEMLAWERPKNMIQVTWEKRKWSTAEDEFILSHSLIESVNVLRRTEKSIKVRLSRLRPRKKA
ncbi:MAG: LAGLIDADG family homing endonuclease [Bacteroidota bacterium]|jgi:hypothetical protein